jgi:hypothetical protein
MFCPENINPEIIKTLRTIPTYALAKRLLVTEVHCFSACKRASIFEIYTQEYVDGLTAFITMRFGKQARVVEACAGDGRLTKALQQRGIDVTAVDDRSRGARDAWARHHRPHPSESPTAPSHPKGSGIDYPGWVIKADAIEYIKEHKPDLIIASWIEMGDELDQRLVETGIPLIIIAETSLGGTTGTNEFWERNDLEYERLKEISSYNLSRADAGGHQPSFGTSTSTHLVTLK